MSKDSFTVTAQRGPLQAITTQQPMACEQRWRCRVCGQEMGYSQPISLEMALALLQTFLAYHQMHCGKEVKENANPAAV